MKIWKPEEQDLRAGIAEAGALSGWEVLYVNRLAAVILKDPLRYRNFGPYWWALKRAMIDQGILEFGDEIDLESFEAIDYGSTELNVAAAYAYEDARHSGNLNIYDDTHILQGDNGEVVEYVISDSGVEIFGAKL